jgi:UPF0755 protein
MSIGQRIALAIGLPLVIVGSVVVYGAVQLFKPVDISQPTDFYVSPKMSLNTAISQLESRSIITSPTIARIFARVVAWQSERVIQRGVFTIEPGMEQFLVIVRLFSKRNLQTATVTFQEGITLRKYAEIASEKIGCDKGEFLRIAYSDSLRKARGITTATIEGYLMPNTYEFYKKTPANEILDKLLDEQDEFWASVVTTGTTKLDRHQTLTLASIVEAETPVDDEKPRVAGVYWNRFKIGMKLEADPTVQYVYDIKNPNRTSRRLLFADLEIESPFNTYKYAGLPPAPINSPGRAAIQAALNPESHGFYYFVAKLDGTNTHTFTRTGAEHQQAVALFRARRRAGKINI